MAHDILSREESRRLTKLVLDEVSASVAQVSIYNQINASSLFARGKQRIGTEEKAMAAWVEVEVDGRTGSSGTDDLTEAGLREIVRMAESLARENPSIAIEPMRLVAAADYKEPPKLFFETTVSAMDAEAQAGIAVRAMEAAEAAKMTSAGEVKTEITARAVANTNGVFLYSASTYGEFSMTARDVSRSASGWGWSGFEDWARVNTDKVRTRAIDLATRSANPVAVEPGRYTVILEPAATADLIGTIANQNTHEFGAGPADIGLTVYGKKPYGTNKIGLQMMDRRLGVVANPWDPDHPTNTAVTGFWYPVDTVNWFEKGVLKHLMYDYEYAKYKGREPLFAPKGMRLTADGPSTSLDEMIASTKRGIWVSRLSNISMIVSPTLLLTGTTRDGTFLIENGKVTKPIKNFRFTESPFFVLNQLEAWGEAERASRDTVVPRLKLRDFNFTSLTDAI